MFSPHFLSDQPACDQGLEMRAGGNKEAFKKDGNGDLMVFISCIFAEFLRCEDGETCGAYQRYPPLFLLSQGPDTSASWVLA